jgi:hypothetical protein
VNEIILYDVNIAVGDGIKINDKAGDAVKRHLFQETVYTVTKIEMRKLEKAVYFWLDGGRCNDLHDICNERGWIFTNEFEIIKPITEDEVQKARSLPDVVDVASFFGVKT